MITVDDVPDIGSGCTIQEELVGYIGDSTSCSQVVGNLGLLGKTSGSGAKNQQSAVQTIICCEVPQPTYQVVESAFWVDELGFSREQ